MPAGRKRDSEIDEKIEQVIKLIEQGLFVNHAAASCGLSKDTLYNRMREDPEVRARVIAAGDKAFGLMEKIVMRAALQDWKASAWYLERRKPELYGRRMKLDISKMSTEQLQELLEQLDDERFEIDESL
jgi:hypothetical protein